MRNLNKRFFTLLWALVLIVALYILIQKTPLLFKKEERVLKSLSKELINRVMLVDDKDKTTVDKKNKSWLINDFPADEERIEKIIEAVLNLKKEEMVSGNKNKYADFEVEGKRKIELAGNTVYIGKTYSYGKSYFRVDSDPNVYLADEDLSAFFYPKDFRDLRPHFINNESKVDKVEEQWKGGLLKLTKKNDQWVTLDNKTAKKDRVDFLINDIKTLKGEDALDKKKIDLSNYPLDLSIIVSEEGKEKKGLFYKIDNEKYYFYQEGSNYIYQIPSAYVASLKKEEKELVK